MHAWNLLIPCNITDNLALYLDVACRDLLEVCEAQLQFGTKAELPVFGGSRGPDISKSITDIQVSLLLLQLNLVQSQAICMKTYVNAGQVQRPCVFI